MKSKKFLMALVASLCLSGGISADGSGAGYTDYEQENDGIVEFQVLKENGDESGSYVQIDPTLLAKAAVEQSTVLSEFVSVVDSVVESPVTKAFLCLAVVAHLGTERGDRAAKAIKYYMSETFGIVGDAFAQPIEDVKELVDTLKSNPGELITKPWVLVRLVFEAVIVMDIINIAQDKDTYVGTGYNTTKAFAKAGYSMGSSLYAKIPYVGTAAAAGKEEDGVSGE